MNAILYQLPYGDKEISFHIESPERVDVIGGRNGSKPPSFQQERDLLRAALDNPIDSPHLWELAAGRNNAVILISDKTRLCPSYLFLDLLLDELNQGGIADSQIQIIVALGMHRKQTEQELKALVGENAWGRVRVLNHSADPEDCVLLGQTSRGVPVEINRLVAHADLRIATGNIEPHRLAGMSGGVKALLPGVASSACIEQNHALSLQKKAEPGHMDNPVHQDMEEAERFAPLHYLLNVVVDPHRHILFAAAGNPKKAHQAGLEAARSAFFVPVNRLYDLVIVSAGGSPKDMQLYQAIKTLQNASVLAKKGAPLLFAGRCEEIYGNGLLQLWAETAPNIETAVNRLKEHFILGPHKLLAVHELTKQNTVYIKSEIPDPIIELLGFRPAPQFQQTVELLSFDPRLHIAVLPYGAITFPLVPVTS